MTINHLLDILKEKGGIHVDFGEEEIKVDFPRTVEDATTLFIRPKSKTAHWTNIDDELWEELKGYVDANSRKCPEIKTIYNRLIQEDYEIIW